MTVSSGLPTVAIPALATVAGDCPAITRSCCTSHFIRSPPAPTQNSTTVAKGTVIAWSPQAAPRTGRRSASLVSAGPADARPFPRSPARPAPGATTTLSAVGLERQLHPAVQLVGAERRGHHLGPHRHCARGDARSTSSSRSGPQPVTIPSNLYRDDGVGGHRRPAGPGIDAGQRGRLAQRPRLLEQPGGRGSPCSPGRPSRSSASKPRAPPDASHWPAPWSAPDR